MSDDIEALKRDISATRARLNASVEALAYRADVPARTKEKIDARVEAVKASALRTIGLGRRTVVEAADHAKSVAQHTIDVDLDAVRAGSEDAVIRVRALAASVSRNAAGAREKFGEPLQRVSDLLPQLHHGSDPSSSDPSSSKGQPDLMRAFLARNPLGFALTGVAVGLLIGFVLPISEIERDTVGPIGQHLIDDATSAANDVIDQGKAVVATIVGEP